MMGPALCLLSGKICYPSRAVERAVGMAGTCIPPPCRHNRRTSAPGLPDRGGVAQRSTLRQPISGRRAWRPCWASGTAVDDARGLSDPCTLAGHRVEHLLDRAGQLSDGAGLATPALGTPHALLRIAEQPSGPGRQQRRRRGIRPVASAVRRASAITSVATAAKPRPALPPRATSGCSGGGEAGPAWVDG